MRFVVGFEGQRRSVDLVFGTPMHMRGLLRWRASAAGRSDPHVIDAMEFRKLGPKAMARERSACDFARRSVGSFP